MENNKINDIFTKEIIEKYKQNKDLITQELLDTLRESNEGKDIAFQMLDLDKNEEGYYLDSFGQQISYKKIPTLKAINRRLPLTEIHKSELKKCSEDIYYFMRNYVKIKTPKGVNYPDLRYYQLEFLDCIMQDEHESIVGLLPRQCCTDVTTLTIEDIGNITFKELYDISGNSLKTYDTKFIESKLSNKRILTPNGYKNITAVHKTKQFSKYKIVLDNGLELEAASEHVIMDSNNNELYIKDSLNKIIKTELGLSKVISVQDLKTKEHMYDISIDSSDELYYSNGVLSHNSGKSVTVGIWLVWLALFEKDVNIGIAAQLSSMAKEFLTKVKDIFVELPIWMTPGIKSWNMTSISLENGVRLLSDTASSNSFRGHTITYSVTDEAAYITGNDNGMTKFNAFLDSMLPSQSSLAKKKNIFISTANGMNDFCDLYMGAIKDGFYEITEILKPTDILYADTIEGHYNSIQNKEIIKEDNILNIYKLNENEYKVTYLKRKIGANNSIAFSTDWRKVPRWHQDGTPKTPDEFRAEVIAAKGEVFFAQAYANKFAGSSYTLINAEKLNNIVTKDPIDMIDGKLEVYYEYEKNHQYLCTVDPAKDGIDGFVVNIIDITGFKFKQVACANLDIDYLLMPEYLEHWCSKYNYPYLIIENNEGAGQSVTDQMVKDYEYPNIHYDKNTNQANQVKAKKKYSGTRTTKKSRNQILKTLKTFFDNGNLEINHKGTIEQLHTFILINGKYQADIGKHDDCVMGLALAFILFNDVKNFTDMTTVTEAIKSDIDNNNELNVADIITIGSFDYMPEIEHNPTEILYEGFGDESFGEFNADAFNSFGDYDISEFG